MSSCNCGSSCKCGDSCNCSKRSSGLNYAEMETTETVVLGLRTMAASVDQAAHVTLAPASEVQVMKA
ncbi:metallothionein protein [Trifolium repens]|nr:metallothionein protein [Trifolium repens]